MENTYFWSLWKTEAGGKEMLHSFHPTAEKAAEVLTMELGENLYPVVADGHGRINKMEDDEWTGYVIEQEELYPEPEH